MVRGNPTVGSDVLRRSYRMEQSGKPSGSLGRPRRLEGWCSSRRGGLPGGTHQVESLSWSGAGIRDCGRGGDVDRTVVPSRHHPLHAAELWAREQSTSSTARGEFRSVDRHVGRLKPLGSPPRHISGNAAVGSTGPLLPRRFMTGLAGIVGVSGTGFLVDWMTRGWSQACAQTSNTRRPMTARSALGGRWSSLRASRGRSM